MSLSRKNDFSWFWNGLSIITKKIVVRIRGRIDLLLIILLFVVCVLPNKPLFRYFCPSTSSTPRPCWFFKDVQQIEALWSQTYDTRDAASQCSEEGNAIIKLNAMPSHLIPHITCVLLSSHYTVLSTQRHQQYPQCPSWFFILER